MIQRDPGIEARRKLAALMTARQKTGPVRTGMEGAGRLAQAMANAYGGYKAEKDQGEYLAAGNEDLARIISDYGQDVRPLSQHPSTGGIASQIQMMQTQQDQAGEAAASARERSLLDAATARQHGLEDYETKKQIDKKYPKPASEFDQYLKTLQAEKIKLSNEEKANKLKLAGKAESAEKHSIQTAYNMADKLRNAKGFGDIYGSIQGKTPTLRQSSVDAEAIRDQLGNILTLAARGALKGQGQVSDSETKMLQQAQTMLNNPRISDEVAAEEVQRVMDYLAGKGAIPIDVAAPSQTRRGRRNNNSVPSMSDIEAEIQRRAK